MTRWNMIRTLVTFVNLLTAIIRLKNSMGYILINSDFMANFNCCPLVWIFCSASSLKKIENFQKRAVWYFCSHFELSFEALWLKSANSLTNFKQSRTLCIELFIIINKLNPSFGRDLSNFFFVKNVKRACK